MRILNDSTASLTGSIAKASYTAAAKKPSLAKDKIALDTAEISDEARVMQEKRQLAEPADLQDWSDVIDRGNGKFTARFHSAAEIAGIADRVGSIEAGKDADLVLFAGDPFEVMSSPEMVMIGGERIEL